jgi:hypothetical protein
LSDHHESIHGGAVPAEVFEEALGGSEQYDDLVREFRRKLSAALN